MSFIDPTSKQVNFVRTWSNFFSGLIWLITGYLVIVLSQIIAAIVVGVLEAQKTGVTPDESEMQRIFEDGDLIGFSFPPGMIAVVVLITIVIKFRRKCTVTEYLALNSLPPGIILRWVGLAGLVMIANFASDFAFNRPNVPAWTEAVFNSVDYKLLFVIGLTISGPILEEVLCRGYVLRAWMESKLHPCLAILLVTSLWTLMHLQYDLYDMSWVFILGLLLAYSRIRSGSLYPAIAIHCAWNFSSYLALEYYLGN